MAHAQSAIMEVKKARGPEALPKDAKTLKDLLRTTAKERKQAQALVLRLEKKEARIRKLVEAM